VSSTWINKETAARTVAQIKSLKIVAFRAIDDKAQSMKFAEGHASVLKNHGINKVSTMGADWIEDPGVYVLMITSPGGERVYGGARIHRWSKEKPLPCQRVFRLHDDRTDEVFEEMGSYGAAEFCALWTSVELAGLGISAKDVVKCGWSLCEKLGIGRMIALLSPVTRKWIPELGLEQYTQLANNGEIPYPTDRFIATLTVYRHPENRALLNEEFLSTVVSLEKHPVQKQEMNGIRGKVQVHFDLLLDEK
jgi:hypothetical protein